MDKIVRRVTKYKHNRGHRHMSWIAQPQYGDVIMSAMTSQITGVSIVCLTACPGTDQRTHQTSASVAFLRGIHRWPVDSLRKGQVTRKIFPFDDVIIWFALGSMIDVVLINALWRYITTYIWANIGWGNGLLSGGTKSLHEPCWLLVK